MFVLSYFWARAFFINCNKIVVLPTNYSSSNSPFRRASFSRLIRAPFAGFPRGLLQKFPRSLQKFLIITPIKSRCQKSLSLLCLFRWAFKDRTEGVSKMSMGIFKEAFWGVLQMRIKKIEKRK